MAEEGFEPYYSSFMPGIKAILTSATSAEQAIVRGKAMECAGLLGEAVGVKVFAADALELMTLFARTIVSFLCVIIMILIIIIVMFLLSSSSSSSSSLLLLSSPPLHLHFM